MWFTGAQTTANTPTPNNSSLAKWHYSCKGRPNGCTNTRVFGTTAALCANMVSHDTFLLKLLWDTMIIKEYEGRGEMTREPLDLYLDQSIRFWNGTHSVEKLVTTIINAPTYWCKPTIIKLFLMCSHLSFRYTRVHLEIAVNFSAKIKF